MPLLAFFAFAFFTLAVGLFAFRRRPPKLLLLALPLLILTAGLQPGGKPLALLLLGVDGFALRALLRPLAFRAALPGGVARLWALAVALLFEFCLLALARPLCERTVDLVLVACVIAPLSWIFGDYALRYLVLPGLWRCGEEREALVWVKGDRLVVDGLLYYIPQWLWNKGAPENKIRARLVLCPAPLGAGTVKRLTPLGAGWQLEAGGPLVAEFNDLPPCEERGADREILGADRIEDRSSSVTEEDRKRVVGFRPALFVLGLTVGLLGCEAAVFAWVLYYKSLVKAHHALLIGLLLSFVCLSGACVPFYMMLRRAGRIKSMKNKRDAS